MTSWILSPLRQHTSSTGENRKGLAVLCVLPRIRASLREPQNIEQGISNDEVGLYFRTSAFDIPCSTFDYSQQCSAHLIFGRSSTASYADVWPRRTSFPLGELLSHEPGDQIFLKIALTETVQSNAAAVLTVISHSTKESSGRFWAVFIFLKTTFFFL